MADRVTYTPQPYASDPRTMLDLLRLASADRSRADQNRAALRSQGTMNIGQLIAGTLASIRQTQEQRQAQAFAQQKYADEQRAKQQDEALKVAQFQSLEQQRAATDAARAETAKVAAEAQAYKRGSDLAARGPGPLAESQVDDAMAGPGAAQVRYSFGPGTAEGPELQPTQAQALSAARLKSLEGLAAKYGGMVNPAGTGLVFPPKPEAPGSLDQQIADALAKGDTATVNRLRQAAGIAAGARRAPEKSTDIPGDWDTEGDAFLQSIPAQWRKTVEKIAKYDEDPTKVASMRGGNREQLMMWVNQVNPKYDQSQFALRSPTRKAFTIGTQGQQINAINTALGHIDQMDALISKLGNSKTVPVNELVNWARTTFGSDKVTNFDTLKDALSAEVASVLSKGQATVSEIAEQRKKIHDASSPAQLVGYMKTQIPIMGSKLANLDYQYKQAMGDDNFSALSEHSKQILMKHGFDPAHPEITGDNSTKSSPNGAVKIGGFTVREKP